MYSISFAELGSTTAELEEKLTVTLQLAAHWGCLALLDEGDALVEKRKQGQLLLNSMTGVLLRLLETFEGSLFINSNRVASFDPAALVFGCFLWLLSAVFTLYLDTVADGFVLMDAGPRHLALEHDGSVVIWIGDKSVRARPRGWTSTSRCYGWWQALLRTWH